jgi:uncharacterized repeat protein (TIGR02543 family)
MPAWSASVAGNVIYTAQWTWEPIVLSQGPVVFYHIYGGGGNANGVYSNDFVVLKNISSVPVSVEGWKIRYTSYAGTIWTTTGPLSGSICPGTFYVIKAWLGANTPPQPALPYFHASLPALAIDLQQYKIQLLNQNDELVDFIGTGAANEYLGSGAAPATAGTGANRSRQSIIRNPAAQDPYSGNNNLDYIIQSPTDIAYLQTDQIYTIAFDKNSGDTEAIPASLQVAHGNTITLPAKPSKAHSAFNGWNTHADGTGTAFDQATPVTACLRLYAQWIQDEYSITYKPGDHGTFEELAITGLHFGDAMPAEPVITGQPGWTITGWEPVKAATVAETTAFTAQWRWTGIPVEFVPGEHGRFDPAGAPGMQLVDLGGAALAPTVIPDYGYEFTGWDAAFTQVTDSLTVTAQYNIKTFDVTFNAMGGSGVSTIAAGEGGTILPPVDPTRDGFMFGGWYKVLETLTPWDFAVDTVTANITLYALWTPVVISGLPEAYTMHVGDRVTWLPAPHAGQWDWDINYFSAAGAPLTFTALSKGNTTVTYTAYGVTHSIYVTILPRADLPDTGEHGMDSRITSAAAMLLGCLLILVYHIRKKKTL